MRAADVLLKPEEGAMLLVDFQAGPGFGVQSASKAGRAVQRDWTRHENV